MSEYVKAEDVFRIMTSPQCSADKLRDFMRLQRVEIKAEEDCDFLPRTYAEIEYEDLDTPEALEGCHFDDMNYLRYRER